jgi:hypothetical protein
MSPPEIAVVMIARVLGRSLAIPIIPKSRATGTDRTMSNPPRAASGLPQPGWRAIMQTIVKPAAARNVADIFP